VRRGWPGCGARLRSAGLVARSVKRTKPPTKGRNPKDTGPGVVEGLQCPETTKTGKRCRGKVREEPEAEGRCLAHAPEAYRQSRGFGGSQPGAGRPRNPRPMDVIREVVQADTLRWLEGHFRALGVEVKYDANGEVVLSERAEGPAKLYGTSKEGDVYVSPHVDVEAMQRAAERLFDRGFGKPVQTNLLGQADDAGPIEVDVPTTAERLKEVADTLKELELD
jgi:hypothetical protein